MILTLEQIKAVTKGVEYVSIENGNFVFHRFNPEEEKVINSVNVAHAAGVQMEFKTDAKRLKLKIATRDESGIRFYFAVDIFENGELLGNIKNFPDGLSGRYAGKRFDLGEFECDLPLGNDEKTLRVVFPHSVITELVQIELEGATFITPVKRDKLIVFYGDSITQGYDVLHPSKSYAMLLCDALNADSYNKAIGGARFSPELAKINNGRAPDYVVVAYGTNDWGGNSSKDEITTKAKAFMDNLTASYPDSKIFVISPIWRWDFEEIKNFGSFKELEEMIRNICEGLKNVTFVSGVDLVPHDSRCFGDEILHPNEEGFSFYCKNLLDKLGF